jgi:Tol biopolymer transport system component
MITFSFTLHNVTLILAVLILVLVNLCPVNITYNTCNGGLYFGTGDQKGCSILPRFSPDGSKLIYFDNDIGGPHYQCSRLLMVCTIIIPSNLL